MVKGGRISKEQSLSYVAVLVAVAGALFYSTLHYTLIVDPMPLTMREPAPILISEAYAEQLKDGFGFPYTVEEYPESTSVYGPIYTMLTGAVQLALDVDPYLLQRCIVGLAVLASSLLCGLLVARVANWHSGLLSAVWLYLTQITDSTVASGPSALAVLFYVLGIAAILQFNTGWRGLTLAMLAGFLGLLTKPYVVLVIPAVLIYTYLFHSPRRALIAAAATAVASCVLFYLASIYMPTYFHSVFQIHSAYATRHLDHLLSQTYLFSKLNFALLAAFLLAFPLSGCLIPKRWLPKCLWGTQPIIFPDIGFDRLLVLIAGAVLLLSLGWHGGAYLIYFNHLLLPALLIAAFRYSQKSGMRFFILRAALIVNLAVLVVERPPMREENTVHLAVMGQLMNKSVLVDPVFDPIARLFDTVDVIDNGQTEYLVNHDLRFGGPLARRSEEWSDQLASSIASGEYEGIYLSPIYYRELLLKQGKSSDLLSRYYERVHVAPIPVYFSRFKDRSYLGKGIALVYYFKRRENISKNTSSG